MTEQSANHNHTSLSQWGLRTKIVVWVFVPAAIILLAVALLIFVAYQQVTEDLVMERNQEVTRLSAIQLAAALTDYTHRLDTEGRKIGLSGNDAGAQRASLQRAKNRLVIFDGGVLILNNFGRVVATEPAYPDILGEDWSNRPYFRQMLRLQRAIFSDITETPDGSKAIAISVPMIGTQGESTGTLVGFFRLGAAGGVSSFYGDIVRQRIGQKGIAYLVDGQGQVIYHSESQQIGGDYSAQSVVQRVLEGETSVYWTQDLHNNVIVAGYAPLPGMSWGLVIQEKWSTLTRNSQGYREFLVFLLILGVIVPAFVVGIGLKRITDPLTDLMNATQGVAEGKFEQQIIVKSNDEIGALSRQFNQMAIELRSSYGLLEQRVSERTRNLTALNAIAETVSQLLDLDVTLNQALDKTLQVMGMESGGIYLLDEETGILTISAHQGFKPGLVEELDQLMVGEGFSGYVAATGQPLIIEDIANDPRMSRSAASEAGIHSLISVPLRAKGKIFGTLFINTYGYHEFTEQDIQLLIPIGHQIGVAIENSRLFESEQRRAEHFRIISEIGRHTLSILALDELLEQTAHLIKEGFNYHQVGFGLIEQDELVVTAGAGLGWENLSRERARLTIGEEGITGWVAAHGEPLLVPDVREDPRYYPVPTEGEVRSELAVPLKIKEVTIGVLDVQSEHPNAFNQEDVVVLQALANQVAIGIENVRLYQQATELATMQERSRLARDLHDSVTQSLYSLTLLAEGWRRMAATGRLEDVIEPLETLGEVGTQALKEMRLLIYQLRPPDLEQDGLLGALHQRLDAVEKRAGIEARLLAQDVLELPAHLEEGLYRIAQEALNNALKHAVATSITIRLQTDQDCILLNVIDDGQGFDYHPNNGQGGLGLKSMQERAEQLGGWLTLESSPGKGTAISVEIPFEEGMRDPGAERQEPAAFIPTSTIKEPSL